MRKRFAILLGLIALLSVQLVYGDPVETRGKWGDKYYRSINPLPPSLSIQGNILSVDFMNALENLTITITDEQGTVIMEDNISKICHSKIGFRRNYSIHRSENS